MADRPLDLVVLAAERLGREHIENARLEAELLLAHVLGLRRIDLYLQFERPLTPEEVGRYREALRRRLRREPLQYITGHAAFRELDREVDRRVLIPRPETELLVGVVLDWAHHVVDASGPEGDSTEGTVGGGGAAGGGEGGGGLSALDLGTGSGAIALSLLHEGPFGRVLATDVSADALDVARSNAIRLGLAERLDLRQGDVWQAVGDERFDVVVSNPPYVADAERASLMPEVRDWEPASALFSEGDPLAMTRRIVDGTPAHLRSRGLLALEVAAGRMDGVRSLIEAAGAFEAVRVVRDHGGHERVVTAGKAESKD
ncbi:MAG: peptide chain release factor N(5)-glutamine methyltransferase [Gemmatimonadota bacterium]